MIPIPTGVRVWLATGHTDMRRGFPSLSLQVQEVLRQDPLCGHLFCFRGRKGDLLKVIWHDGQGGLPFHQASGERPFPVAKRGRWDDIDLASPAGLLAFRYRLAPSPENLAPNIGRLTVCL